jgi:uncharacterized protein (TIGR00369 family)
MDQEHFLKLEKMYLGANVNQQIFDSSKIRVRNGLAEISLNIEDKYFHALGAIHGSVYFKLLDDAAFFAVQSIIKDVFVLTTSFNINITRPVKEGELKAVGKIRFQSRNFFIAEATLMNDNGKEVAFGTGHFSKSKIGLSEKIGYQ